MRRLGWSLLAVAAVSVVFGTTAQAVKQRSTVVRGPKVTFLVWPHGHPAIASVKFPEIRNPHVELYLGFGTQYPEILAGAYILGGKPPPGIPIGSALGPCLNYGNTVVETGTVTGGVTFTAQTALKCTLPASGVVDTGERPGGVRFFILHAGRRILARADVTPTHASLTVPKGVCRKAPPPR